MRGLLHLIGFKLFKLSISLIFLFTVFIHDCFSETVSNKEIELVDQINQAFQKAGIFEAYVQYDEAIKMFELKGKFRNYDEFLYAYMIAQVYAGVKKVSPVYNIKHAVIIHTPIELCLPYAFLNLDCPYTVNKTKQKVDRKESINILVDNKTDINKKYALVLGISKFKNENISSVLGADSDALIWGKYLEDRGYQVTYLINEEATKENVEKFIDTIISKLNENDTFVFFVSSHGVPKNEKGEVGIMLYDSGDINSRPQSSCRTPLPPGEEHLQAAEKMCTLVKDSLSIEQTILKKLEGKKVNFIPIIDACYSGDALRGYLGDVIKSEEVAPLDFYEKRLKVLSPEALKIVVTSSSGFRLSYSAPLDVFARSSRTVFKRDLSELPYSVERVVKRVSEAYTQSGKEIEKLKKFTKSHGIFSFYLVNALPENENQLVKALESVRDYINSDSEYVCKNVDVRGIDRTIRIVTERQCPKGGQNPIVLKIRKEEFNL